VRIAILSDIHGNLEALEAVLAEVDRSDVDLVYSLGDIVGYGPSPAACLDIVRRRAAVSLMGNHDAAVAGLTSHEDFNDFARSAVEWTAARLDVGQIEYLGMLPYTHCAPGLLLVHASPLEPERWNYIHGMADIAVHFAAFAERLCFVGHSHRPGAYAISADGGVARRGESESLRPGLRYLVNAGSVGQPRDRDPRAAYVIFDAAAESVEVRRVAYPVARTQERMRAAGIPAFLIDRIGAGV
jgi:diadenosine tetraphosphatase ApaH/serine/threonine PP2A family protein phosphatase